MQIQDIRFVVCLILLSASGCATTEPAYIPLAKEASQQIKSSNTVIVSTQHEIKADVEKSNVTTYTGGGLIPALIDVAIESSRAKSAEEHIKPIRDALADFDMGRELQTSIGTRLDGIPWLNVKKTEILYDIRPELVATLLASSSEDALILVTPSYSLTSDFVALKAEAEVKVLPRAAHLRASGEGKDNMKGQVKPLYKNVVTHITPLVTGASDKKAAAAEWSKDSGDSIKQAMKRSVASLADRIVGSLMSPDSSGSGQLSRLQ